MVSIAIKQQIRDEQRKRIAAIILEDLFAYSGFSSGPLIAKQDEKIPRDLSAEDAAARRKAQQRCQQALMAANRIQLYLRGELD